jgi:hypothetical protein
MSKLAQLCAKSSRQTQRRKFLGIFFLWTLASWFINPLAPCFLSWQSPPVRKKRVILLCVVVVVVALVVLLAYTSTIAEPFYNGHPLNYWVLLLSVTPAPVLGSALPNAENDKATNAINDIGTAAVPFLVKWIQFEPPPSKHAFGYWLSRTHFPFGQNIYDLVTRQRAARLASGAVSAFGILGTRATPALDELCRLMNQTNATFTCRRALAALSFLGPNSLPPLLTVVTNEYSGLRVEALDYIAAMPNLGDAAAELAVPPLAQCLSETNNPLVQENAAYALGRLKGRYSGLHPRAHGMSEQQRQDTSSELGASPWSFRAASLQRHRSPC